MALALAVSGLAAGGLEIQLPPETASFRPVPGVELANAQCLTCHSVDYVLTQPLFPRVFWSAEIKKMKAKFGAPIPDEQIEPLVDYLAKNYGIETNSRVSTVMGANSRTITPNPQPVSVETLATRYGCLSCHKVNVKVVGPAFKDVAAKYRDDPAALDKICRQIHNGGTGKWGSAVMPPFTAMSDAEARMLARWVMRQAAQP